MSNLILPTNFVGDRIFVCPITIDGVKLTFYTDTGGGAMLIAPSTVERLNLEVFKETTDEEELESVHFPEFRADAYLPSAINSDLLYLFEVGGEYRDGLLGQSWFADRVWEFDYLRQKLTLLEDWLPHTMDSNHVCLLGFLKDADEKRSNAFPRISAMVDGEQFDFLFDTGATVYLADAAMASFDVQEPR